MATLITGIAGGLAQIVARELASGGEEVVGVDYRNVDEAAQNTPGAAIYRASYSKTAVEDVFRKHRIESVLHLGRVGNLSEGMEKRFELNVIGSQKLMQLCLQHHAKTLVVLSTFHIYGAHPRNHTPISEDDPLRAGPGFPEIADAIQLDNMASTWIYKHPEVRTVVLRPTNVVGPHIQNTMSKFLRLRRIPKLVGYNPMTQFLHEDDLARAVILASRGNRNGVFNVAGPEVVPWSAAIALTGARPLPLPSTLVRAYMRAFSSFPQYLVNFFKYPCVIGDGRFRAELGWQPRVSIRETLRSTAASAPPN
jgi:UDP-glucose 4-epimerase